MKSQTVGGSKRASGECPIPSTHDATWELTASRQIPMWHSQLVVNCYSQQSKPCSQHTLVWTVWLRENIQGTELCYKKVGEICPRGEEGANAIHSSHNKVPLQGGKGKGVIVDFVNEIVTWVHREWHCKAQNHQIRHKAVLLSSLYQERQ